MSEPRKNSRQVQNRDTTCATVPFAGIRIEHKGRIRVNPCIS